MFKFLRRNAVAFILFAIIVAIGGPQIARAIDSVIDGNIVFTGPGQGGAKDIRTSNTDGGLRIYNGSNLSPIPTGAAIQFFGNTSSSYPGQAFIDSGAHNSGAIIFRTAATGEAITERMRINAAGDISTTGRFAMGQGALASRPAEKAFANGSFATPGDAQSSIFILRGEFPSDPTPGARYLGLDGSQSNPAVTIAPGHSFAMQLQGVMRGGTTGASAIFSCEVVIKNVGGTVSLNGAPNVVICPNGPGDTVPLSVEIGTPGTNGIFVRLSWSGALTEVYRIVATVRTTEVGFAVIP